MQADVKNPMKHRSRLDYKWYVELNVWAENLYFFLNYSQPSQWLISQLVYVFMQQWFWIDFKVIELSVWREIVAFVMPSWKNNNKEHVDGEGGFFLEGSAFCMESTNSNHYTFRTSEDCG